MNRACTIALGLLVGWNVSGCETRPDAGRIEAILTVTEACQAYASALRVLAAHRAAGQLTLDEVAAVDASNAAVDPLCLGEPPASAGDAAIAVVNQVAALMLIVAQQEDE